MKKLGKLSINPEKVMKNEELINLKGGYDDGYESWYTCTCTDESGNIAFQEDIDINDWAIDRYLNDLCWSGHTGNCTAI